MVEPVGWIGGVERLIFFKRRGSQRKAQRVAEGLWGLSRGGDGLCFCCLFGFVRFTKKRGLCQKKYVFFTKIHASKWCGF